MQGISINLERNTLKGEKSRIVSCDIRQVWAILVSMFPSFPRYEEGTGGRGQIEPGLSVQKHGGFWPNLRHYFRGLTTDQIILLQVTSFLSPLSDQKCNKGKSRSFTTLTRFCSVYCCHSSFEKRNYHHTVVRKPFLCLYFVREVFLGSRPKSTGISCQLVYALVSKSFSRQNFTGALNMSASLPRFLPVACVSQMLYSQCSL